MVVIDSVFFSEVPKNGLVNEPELVLRGSLDFDGDNILDIVDPDDDNDGIPDEFDDDDDNDGIRDADDPDDDNDGVPDEKDGNPENFVGYGIPDSLDDDDDGDGVAAVDAQDNDDNGDGIAGDSDDDSVPNDQDNDDDGDGTHDALDDDDDNNVENDLAGRKVGEGRDSPLVIKKAKEPPPLHRLKKAACSAAHFYSSLVAWIIVIDFLKNSKKNMLECSETEEYANIVYEKIVKIVNFRLFLFRKHIHVKKMHKIAMPAISWGRGSRPKRKRSLRMQAFLTCSLTITLFFLLLFKG